MHIAIRLLLAVLLLASGPVMAEKLPRLILAGPSSSVSNPLIHMVESGALNDLADKVEFVSWRDPDQLRLMALNGQADVLAMPVNVAANLYNRGAKLRLLNVSTWGLLWLVSRDPGLTTIADLRGKEITMPFRGDMPDILFGLLAERAGLDVRKDLRLRYVATPIDAMQLLLMRRTDHALLAEPAISMALRKAGSGPLSLVAPELHRSIDLQQEWGRLLQREARITTMGKPSRFLVELAKKEHIKIEPIDGKALEPCPECGHGVLQLRSGRYGDFYGCSLFPACTFNRKVDQGTATPAQPSPRAQRLPASTKAGDQCPMCKRGVIQSRNGRNGPFLGCSRFWEGCRATRNLSS